MLPTVMIVDDCELQLYVTNAAVRKSLPPAQIICFASAVSALGHLHSAENGAGAFPVVIFLDIHMPFMNGFDFLDEYLKLSEEARSNCEIVMLSSTDAAEDFARAEAYPVIYKFLSKPIVPEKLGDVSVLWKTSDAVSKYFPAYAQEHAGYRQAIHS